MAVKEGAGEGRRLCVRELSQAEPLVGDRQRQLRRIVPLGNIALDRREGTVEALVVDRGKLWLDETGAEGEQGKRPLAAPRTQHLEQDHEDAGVEDDLGGLPGLGIGIG